MKKIIIATIMALVALSASACDGLSASEPEVPGALGIIATSHSNATKVAQADWERLLAARVHPGLSIVVTDDDADPVVLGTAQLVGLPNNPTTRREVIEDLVRRTATVAHEARATSPENDPIAALNLVLRSLDPTARQAACEIVVSSPGLSTSGALKMQDTTLAIDPEDVVGYLKDANTLPRLEGCDVVWIGLGRTAGDQEPLHEPDLRTLEMLWTEILNAAGASSVRFDYNSLSEQPLPDLPDVTPVDLLPLPEPPPPNEAVPVCHTDLSDAQVGFVSESAQFIDPPRAEAAIAAVAEQLRACVNSSTRIVVVATTSSAGSTSGRERVSSERAAAVAAVLAQKLEVTVGEISTIGVGYCEGVAEPMPTCVNDRDAGGNRLLEESQANRRAIITVVPE